MAGKLKQGSDEYLRGQTEHQKRLLSMFRGEVDGNSVKADWSIINPAMLHAFVVAVGSVRGACMLGVDKTGYGYTVNLFLGGEKISQYFLPSEAGVQALEEFMARYVDATYELKDNTQ